MLDLFLFSKFNYFGWNVNFVLETKPFLERQWNSVREATLASLNKLQNYLVTGTDVSVISSKSAVSETPQSHCMEYKHQKIVSVLKKDCQALVIKNNSITVQCTSDFLFNRILHNLEQRI